MKKLLQIYYLGQLQNLSSPRLVFVFFSFLCLIQLSYSPICFKILLINLKYKVNHTQNIKSLNMHLNPTKFI